MPLGGSKAGPWSKQIRRLEQRRKRKMRGKPSVTAPTSGKMYAAPHDSDESEAEMEQLRRYVSVVLCCHLDSSS